MRSRWNLPIYLAYLVFCLLIFGLVVKQIGVGLPWQHQRQVSAVFHSGDGILANNEVFLNGVKVGRVSSVDAVNGKAVVNMVLSDDNAGQLYSDASADIRKKNLLGETYIDLHRGGAATRQPLNGPITATLSPVDIDQVLAILDPQTRQRVQLLINGAGDATKNEGTALNAEAGSFNQTATSLNGPAQELSTRQQQIENVVLELQKLYDMLAKQRDQVRDEVGTWSRVMGQLADQEQAIGGTLQQADLLLQNTDQLLGGEVPNLHAILGQLPASLTDTQAFLVQTNTILGAVAPYRSSVHDVFPALNTAFADTDPASPIDPITGSHQHFWSVYSVNCMGNCSNDGTSTSYHPVAPPNAIWAAAMETPQ